MSDREYLWVILTGVTSTLTVLTILLNGVLLKFVRTLGIREQSTTIIRWSAVSKPSLGGITFFIVFLLALSLYSILIPGEALFHDKSSLAFIGACVLGFLLGLADDAYNTKPVLKFTVQLLCGFIFWAVGAGIKVTPYEWMNFTLTLLWVAGIMNSINMLDNMDAISTTVSITIIASFILVQVFSSNIHLFDLFIQCGVIAALVGFLFHNWHPSRMFMGDTGSQFLGVFLAYFGIRYFWNGTDVNGSIIQAKQVTMVLIAFLPTLVDTFIVSINRISKGKSPFVGGKDHTTHHLSYLGFSDTQVAFVFLALGVASCLMVVVMARLINGWSHLFTILFWSWFFIVFCILFTITRKKRDHGEQGTSAKEQSA